MLRPLHWSIPHPHVETHDVPNHIVCPCSKPTTAEKLAFVLDLVAQVETFSKPKKAQENKRGMKDVYGQMTAEYATQKGSQMEPIGNMLKKLLGIPEANIFV